MESLQDKVKRLELKNEELKENNKGEISWEQLYSKVKKAPKVETELGKGFSMKEYRKAHPRTFTEMFDGDNQEQLKENETFEKIYKEHIKEGWHDGVRRYPMCDCDFDETVSDDDDDMCPDCFEKMKSQEKSDSVKYYEILKDEMGDVLPDWFINKIAKARAGGVSTAIEYGHPAEIAQGAAEKFNLSKENTTKFFELLRRKIGGTEAFLDKEKYPTLYSGSTGRGRGWKKAQKRKFFGKFGPKVDYWEEYDRSDDTPFDDFSDVSDSMNLRGQIRTMKESKLKESSYEDPIGYLMNVKGMTEEEALEFMDEDDGMTDIWDDYLDSDYYVED
jgi:hypothetical protein